MHENMAVISAANPKKVLVIDDSQLMRELLCKIINDTAGFIAVGAAPSPVEARAMIRSINPDILTLDVEMPGMNGLDFLARLMTLRPMPVLMVSAATTAGAEATLEALALGAIDAIGKPRDISGNGLDIFASEVKVKLRAAACARPRAPSHATGPTRGVAIKKELKGEAWKLVLLGASTGGVEALREVMSSLPSNAPPVLITQHMPEGFTAGFARRLNDWSPMQVTEAKHGDIIESGKAFVAPGGKHLGVERSDAGTLRCLVTTSPPISGHRPSVDVLFKSAVKIAGDGPVLGAILTGMGRDGADGLLDLRRAGARTLGQAASTCVVYGMPKAAADIGAVEKEVTPRQIAEEITSPKRPSAKGRISENKENAQ
jgi:two-component system chemotaxis response regulator CheB